MKKTVLLFFLLTAWGSMTGIISVSSPQRALAAQKIMVIELDGPINPGTAMYVTRGLEEAREDGDVILSVIRMDTPGGLASSMRTIVKSILNSPLPVAVFVAPSGARAASAGVMITVAAHIAAMAPGTNIGAAHPVSAGGKDMGKTMSEKMVNDMAAYARGIAENKGRNGEWVEKAIRESVSITAKEALEKNVIDLIANDIGHLIRLLHGKEIKLPSGKVTLKTSEAVTTHFQPSLRDKVLKTISDPNIAYILLMIGLAGLYFELANPGAIFPGALGAISLILAFFSFQTLPVNYAGLLLLILAIVMFILEIKVTSYGMLSIGGLISLTLGSIMLFKNVGVSLRLMMPTILMVGGFFVAVATLAFKAHTAKPLSGVHGLLGEIGVVREAIDPEGLVLVHGETWKAISGETIEPGEKVVVEDVQGLTLRVKKATNQEP